MKHLKTIILAISAGFFIGIGGVVSLMQENKIAGAFLFSIGLLTILVFKFNLYTGMVGYVLESLKKKKFEYLLTVFLVWLGNYMGTALCAGLIRLTPLADKIVPKCETNVQAKLENSWYAFLILGIFCGVLMFIAVDTYKKNIEKKDFLCVVAVFMGVMVFILAGFEHSIADMFYFTLTGHFVDILLPLLLITIGNALGGNLIPIIQELTYEK
ncbi:MAG: formate/nitrite transporter family protein [Lachnospiraceae bacterium]|nr:formate/nitrite transporter family protein [Lachnospiraceae bacterium]